jgi:hypothetical protein
VTGETRQLSMYIASLGDYTRDDGLGVEVGIPSEDLSSVLYEKIVTEAGIDWNIVMYGKDYYEQLEASLKDLNQA